MHSGFYDIHCHILSGVDDGAPNFFDALEMVRIAREDGTRHLVLTPHYHVGHFELPAENLRDRFQIIQNEVAALYPDMKLYLGVEICYHEAAAEKLKQNRLLTMADTDYVLVEFFPQTEQRVILQGLQEIQMVGKRPILAHVERYEKLTGDYDAVEQLIRMGFYIQVNASSVLGKSGRRVKNFTKKLLQNGQVDFIASDAHGIRHRRPMLGECAAYIRKKWGDDYVDELLIRNPKKMLSGKYL